jgi:hypothetical protein
MAWYAYCITEQQAFQGSTRARRPFPIEKLKGIGDAQIMGYPSGEFAVIVSEHVPGHLDQRSVVEHARVVSECFRNTTVLPFRFGTVFDTDEAIRRAVRTNRKAFMESVAKLRGKSEMHLKVMVRDAAAMDEAALPAAVGAEYLTVLRQKAVRDRERQTKARAISIQVHKLFNPLQEEVTCKRVDAGALIIDIAHLIDSAHVDKYQNRYNAAAHHFKDYNVVLSGPWPPYHFMPGKLRPVS